MALVLAFFRIEDEPIGSFVSCTHLQETAHFEVKDLLDCQIHPLPKHPSSVIHFLVIELYFDLFPKVYSFELLDAAHQYIVSVHLDRLTTVFPVHPQFLHLESQPCHLLLEITALHRLHGQITDGGRENPQRLRNCLKSCLLTVSGYLDIDRASEILRALTMIFLKQSHLVDLEFRRVVFSVIFRIFLEI